MSNAQIYDVSKTFEIIYAFFMVSVFVLTSISFIFLIWAIRTNSTKEMRYYKYLLLAYSTNVYIVQCFFCLLQPKFFIHKSIVFAILGGFAEILPVDVRGYECHLLCFLMLIAIQGTYQINFLFVYRFAQTTNQISLQEFLENPKMATSCFLLSFIFLFCGIILPVHTNRMSAESVERYFYENNLTFIVEKYSTKVITAMDTVPKMTILCGIFVGLLSTIIISYTTFKVTQTLKENRNSLCVNTRKLFRSLIHALLLDLFIYSFNVNSLVGIIFVCYSLFPNYLLIVAMLVFMLLCIWPLLAITILLLFIGPYRRAALGLLQKAFTFTKRQKDRKNLTPKQLSVSWSTQPIGNPFMINT